MTKIWVDDIRPAPEGYYWVKTVDLCKDLLRWHKIPSRLGTKLLIEEISLDHDAGDYFQYGGDYIKILDYMEELEINDIPIHLHTANPVGRENMRRIIQKNGWREV